MSIEIDRIDHVVVNCRDVEATAAWYERVLGMRREVFGSDRRTALKFGSQKLNLRPTGPAADWPTGATDAPGSLDLCFIATGSPQDAMRHLNACGVAVEIGPAPRTGALGAMTSVYCRDPDGNLVEIACYPQT
jgi:catechol 2,3-dioxygenase-like lactoylglutathione lyase family enzyme